MYTLSDSVGFGCENLQYDVTMELDGVEDRDGRAGSPGGARRFVGRSRGWTGLQQPNDEGKRIRALLSIAPRSIFFVTAPAAASTSFCAPVPPSHSVSAARIPLLPHLHVSSHFLPFFPGRERSQTSSLR